jgi:O-methyltransferase
VESVKRAVRSVFRSVGLDVRRIAEQQFPPDFDAETRDICKLVSPFTMTSPERIFALRQSVQYLVQNNIQGDFVECGVWRGGSMMAVARTLQGLGVTEKNLYLFDTFDGMSAPTQDDVAFNGESAIELLAQSAQKANPVRAYSALDEVKRNLLSTGYPAERMFFIEGKVEDTIPAQMPERIALLRLDTDWFESTYHELLHLYPRLSPGGVLIIDDYGHWAGARKAVDRYFAEHNLIPLLHRIDYTGRICVKN